jgi:hypothetical protein
MSCNCCGNANRKVTSYSGGDSGKSMLGGFCLTCFSFWIWVAAAVVIFLLLTGGKKKGN